MCRFPIMPRKRPDAAAQAQRACAAKRTCARGLLPKGPAVLKPPPALTDGYTIIISAKHAHFNSFRAALLQNEKNGRVRRVRTRPFFMQFVRVQPSLIALTGHSPAHVPQSRHASASITYLPSPSEMAFTGQTPAQVPQAMQSSLIL